MHVARDHDATRRRFRFQPCRDVHAIAIEIIAIDDQVAEMQPDPKHDGGVFGLILIGVSHRLLELDGGAQRIHGAGKLDQRTVARQLDQPAAVARQTGSNRSVRCAAAGSVPFSSRPISRE